MKKIDMVDEEWLELVTDDIMEFLSDTFLEDAPIVKVSSSTGEGLDEFREVLADVCGKVSDPALSGLFRLPVDRVFTMKGFGTVITGTIASGRVKTGDEIMLYPSGVKSKVRGLQVHNLEKEEASRGMRTAINFQGLDKKDVMRGDVVARAGALKNSYMVDVALDYLKDNPKPLKTRTLVRFHTGTSEIMGRVILLGKEELMPGEAGPVQLRLDTPVAVVKGDRFVLRSYSPVYTIGAGEIINPIPVKHKRFKEDVLESFKGLQEAEPDKIVALLAESRGFSGVSFAELLIMTNLGAKKLNNVLGPLLSKKELLLVDKEARIHIHKAVMERLEEIALELIGKYHEQNPLKNGMPKEELKSRVGRGVETRVFHLLLEKMAKEGSAEIEKNLVRLSGHSVSLGADQEIVEKKILESYCKGGLMPPYFREVVEKNDLDKKVSAEVLSHLVEAKKLVKVKEELYFDPRALEELTGRLKEFLEEKGEISTPQFKEMTGASRKYVIPLLEWFDATKVTLRVGDIRKPR